MLSNQQNLVEICWAVNVDCKLNVNYFSVSSLKSLEIMDSI